MPSDLFGGINEQEKAGKHRLDDARALLDAGRWRGAMYLAGYAVECLLKVKLMRMYGCRNLNELENVLRERELLTGHETIFTHRLETLFKLTRSSERLRSNPGIWKRFGTLNRWMPAWRYTADLSDSANAKDFVQSVEQVVHWIEVNI